MPSNTLSAKRDPAWGPPGWAWELELLTLFFVVIALALPLVGTDTAGGPETGLQRPDGVWWVQRTLLWSVLLVALYFGHLVLAASAIEFVSTPFSHLVAPLFFSCLAYARLAFAYRADPAQPSWATGNVLEVGLLLSAVLPLTILLASWRKRRHARRFRRMHWDVSHRPHVDKSYFAEGLLRIRPFFYLPRRYRACPQGLLIEGWIYVMPIPWSDVKSIVSCREGDFTTSGFYATTSKHELIRIQLYETSTPVFISPLNPYTFLQYCELQLYGKARIDPWKEEAEMRVEVS